jgi:hypothetical protein
MSVRPLAIDMDYVQGLVLELLSIPSPTGRTDRIMQFIGDELGGAYLQTDLTYAKWDLHPAGPLKQFPSSKQPEAVGEEAERFTR